MADVIVTTLRLMGQRAYVSGMQQASSATYRLGAASTEAGGAATFMKKGLIGAEGAVNTMMSASLRLGAGLGVLAGYAVKTGVEFNAGMERARIGMTTLLGSGREARAMVEDVTAFAVKTPLFGIEEMMQAAQQLIGVGFQSKEVVPTLTTFSDTLSALGRKPEDLLRMRYAFTQMMSKGKVSAEELRNQLGEIFPAQRILAREMGISTAELAEKMKESGVKSGKAIRLLLRGMAEDYGGATERMNKTFTGQVKMLTEGTRVMLGNMTFQFTNWLSRDMLPELNRFVSAMADAWDPERKMNLRQRLNRTKQLVRIILGPLADDIGRRIERAGLGDKLVRGLEAAIPRVMEVMGRMSGQAALAFIRGWWDAGPYGKIFAAVVILSRLGAFSAAGGKAADMMIGGLSKRWTGSKIQGKMKNLGKAAGKRAGVAFVAAFLLALVTDFGGVRTWFQNQLKEMVQSAKRTGEDLAGVGKDIGGSFLNRLKGIPSPMEMGAGGLGFLGIGKQTGGRVAGKGGWRIVGEGGPELVRMPTGANIYPHHSLQPAALGAGMGSRRIEVPVYLNRREIARAVADDTAYDMARR